MRKKILLITYYWPPAGGVAVQRWLKMVKYLSNDFDITVYAPLNPEYPSLDNQLEKQVPSNVRLIKRNIFEPYGIFRKLTLKKKDYQPKQEFASIKEKSFLDNLATWIRGNFFIPDARKFWIKPSIKFLSKEIEKNNYDIIISNGTPHSVHLIALKLKERFKLKWVADFRDPWTEVDYFKDLKLSKRANKIHKEREKQVLSSADLVTTVSDTWAENFIRLGAKKVEVLYNGYDEDDFIGMRKNQSSRITIAHIGSLNEDRNKDSLWKAIQQVVINNEEIKNQLEIKLIGNVTDSVNHSLEKYQLKSLVNLTGNIDHKESLQEMLNANVLILLLGDLTDFGRIPAKVFEYLATGNPILAIASDKSDVAKIISENSNGIICNDDTKQIKEALIKLSENTKNWDELGLNNLYSRKAISLKLSSILNQL